LNTVVSLDFLSKNRIDFITRWRHSALQISSIWVNSVFIRTKRCWCVSRKLVQALKRRGQSKTAVLFFGPLYIYILKFEASLWAPI